MRPSEWVRKHVNEHASPSYYMQTPLEIAMLKAQIDAVIDYLDKEYENERRSPTDSK